MKFKSNIEVQAGIEDKDGQVGSNGQILASTGSQVDWIDPANIVTSATDVIIECKNTSGVTIAKGTPVYQTGNVGATAVIEIAVADASDEDKMAAIGLLQSDLINNAFGYVVVTGELLNITTSPIDGSTPAVGDTIYVKPGGGLTLTKPTGVNFIQNVGLVGKVSGGNAGSLTVSSIMRSNDVPTPLYIDHDNQRLGVGVTSPGQKLDVDGSVNIDGTLFVNTNNNHIRLVDTDNTGNFSVGVNSNFQIRDITANTTPLTIRAGTPSSTILTTASGRVGIGLSLPGTTLHVGGFTRIDGGLQLNATNATIYQILESSLRFGTNNTERMRIDAGGNVGIGTTSPSAKLHVKDGNCDIITEATTAGSSARLRLKTTYGEYRVGSNNSDYWVYDSVAGSYRMWINSSGNVGIGTTSPNGKLTVGSSGFGTAYNDYDALYINNGALTAGNGNYGNGIGFSRLGSQTYKKAAIAPVQGTSDSDNLGLAFFTSPNSGFADVVEEAMRINYNGNVGIGTTSPGQKLTVNGDVGITTSNQLFVNDIAAYAGDMIIGPIGASELKFRTAGSERMLIDSSGNVGIGTTSPGVNLEIRGTVNTDDCKIYLKENNTYGAYFKYDGDLNRGYIGGITGTTTENAVLSWGRDGSELKLVTSGSTAVTIDSNRDVTFAEDIIIKEALLSNQKNTDVSGLELVANVLIASYTAAFFDFVIKKGTNVRSGTVYACHDGTNVEFTETSTNDLGDTSDVVLSVDISGTGMRLLADAATSGWSVKSLIRAI